MEEKLQKIYIKYYKKAILHLLMNPSMLINDEVFNVRNEHQLRNPAFMINKVSKFMREEIKRMFEEQRKVYEEHKKDFHYNSKLYEIYNIYTKEDGYLSTTTLESDYPKLYEIFKDCIDSIFEIEKNKGIRDLCKNSPCNKVEEKLNDCKYCFRKEKGTSRFVNLAEITKIIKELKETEIELKETEIEQELKNPKWREFIYGDQVIAYTKFYKDDADLKIRNSKKPNESILNTQDFLSKNRIDEELVMEITIPPYGTVETSKIVIGYGGVSIIHDGNSDKTNAIFKKINDIMVEIISGTIQSSEKEKQCYMLHWLFCNLCPFLKGSAGFAKILLNVALLLCNCQPVKETEFYFKHSDWVALLSPTFEMYYSKKDEMFEIDHQLKEIKKSLRRIKVMKHSPSRFNKKSINKMGKKKRSISHKKSRKTRTK